MDTHIDWNALLLPDTSPIEIFVRGTIMYLGLFTLLRVILKRESGTVGIADLLVVVLIADAAQNGMAGEYTSVSDGLILVVTIIFWSYLINWLGFRFPILQWVLESPPLLLAKDGKLIPRNMRKELITKEDLMKEIRANGLIKVDDVKEAYMESDGSISVIPKDRNFNKKRSKKAI